MRMLAIAGVIAALIMPAHAQNKMDAEQEKSGKAELEKDMAKRKKESEEIEKAYNETMRKTRDQPATKKMDPWANMR